ncbi:hypothetical protein BCR44DRAFT_51961 [Catenaria anguillulae PL171]|uniref:ODAD1 central coiled coil region domain-containing protein n=1 Tax=Catenaria anguillulae PL171 TaxID=765915 RepID=A0A1Y2HC45_9FUNG|nr:hypothetical protein BCR44DRAFT_51961 [Catenaria anguillulae PL171]
MSRAQSVTSGEANDGAVELEYSKLQRTFRVMESERKSYAEEARQLIKKQRSAIDKLRRDNEYLLQELALAQRRIEDTKRNGTGSEKAEILHQRADLHQRRMKTAAEHIGELDKEMDEIHKAMAKQRQQMGGVNAAMVNSLAIEKQIRILENRLDQALVKYNRALANNKRFRGLIDNLRRERLVFDTVYTKFERELTEQKKAMAEIIESSNAAYEARDEAQAKILILSEKAEKEYQAYIQEIKELDRTLEQDRKLRNFLATKAADRHAGALLLGSAGLDPTASSISPSNSPGRLQPKGGAGAAAGAPGAGLSKASSSSQDVLNVSVASYEKVLNHIQEVTGVKSLDELVQRFKDVEEQNFSLFNYVNQVNNEVEKIGEELVRIQRQIDGMDDENKRADVNRNKRLRVLEKHLQDARDKSMQLQAHNDEIQAMVTGLYENVLKLVDAFRSSNVTVTSTTPVAADDAEAAAAAAAAAAVTGPPAASSSSNIGPSASSTAVSSPTSPQQPAASSAITTNPFIMADIKLPAGASTADALLSHLASIEERVNDLLILHQIATNPRAKLASASPTGPNAPAGANGNGSSGSAPGSAAPTSAEGRDANGGGAGSAGAPAGGNAHLRGPTAVVVQIVAPNTGDNEDSDEDADEDRPLSREELASKSLRGLTKRMQNGGGSSKRRRRARMGTDKKD